MRAEFCIFESNAPGLKANFYEPYVDKPSGDDNDPALKGRNVGFFEELNRTRERERERERERQTDRQTDRQTERKRKGERGSKKEKDREGK